MNLFFANIIRLFRYACVFLICAIFPISDCFAYEESFLASDSAAIESQNVKAIETEENDDDVAVEAIRVTTLQGIEVKSGRQKYSKKNNPAYELMKRIRSAKSLGATKGEPSFRQTFYNKTVIGLNNFDGSAFSSRNKYKFLEEYVDTTAHTNLPAMLLSIRESAGVYRYSSETDKSVTEVITRRNAGIDDAFDQENITTMLEEVLRNINIYDNDITLLTNRFVSPLSNIADDYYKYFINDTIEIEGKRYIELTFAPRTPESFGFNGRLYVDADDSTYFIKHIEMRVPRVINLNYIDNVYITQDYIKDRFGRRHLINDDMSLELTLLPGTYTFYTRRLSTYSSPVFEFPEFNSENYDYAGLDKDSYSHTSVLLDKIDKDFVSGRSALQPWEKWEDMRMVPLSHAESGLGSMMFRLRKYPLIYWSEKVLKILVNGYISTGKDSKVDLGPVNTLISYNTTEGVRLRAGGLTTANLSRHWFARGYVAYGFKDRKVKYNAEMEYSFSSKKYHSREFPVNSIRLHYKYDIDQIVQHYLYTNSDNIFLSLKRKSDNLTLYKREAAASYQIELRSNFSFIGEFSHNVYESTPWLRFIDGKGCDFSNYTLSGFRLEFRYAPGEKFYQSRSKRLPVNKDAPVFRLIHEIYPKGLFGTDFTLNKTELSISKRFWFSAFGYTDIILNGGKIWSQVQYPALMWPNANLSYTIQPESYSLMNPMEFAMDYYGSLDISYFANGALFNRIPLIKKLKLREVITFKGLMGGLTSKNDPAKNSNLFRFPADAHVRRLTKTPYMELGIGIDNILTCLRVDYIWRLTYRDYPEATKGGLRVSLHFTF